MLLEKRLLEFANECSRDKIVVTVPLRIGDKWRVSLPVFRKQCSWAWSGSRSAGGGPSSWGVCGTTVRAQESPWGKVQPHPGMNHSHLSSLTSTHLWTHLFIYLFIFQTRNPICLYRRKSNLMSNRHQSPPHPQVHCFDTSFLKTVLYCFYCLFVLTEALYVFLITWFKVCLCPCNALNLPERVQGSHFSYQPVVNLP